MKTAEPHQGGVNTKEAIAHKPVTSVQQPARSFLKEAKLCAGNELCSGYRNRIEYRPIRV